MLPPHVVAIAAIQLAAEVLGTELLAVRIEGVEVNRDEIMLATHEILTYYKFASSTSSHRTGYHLGNERKQYLAHHRYEVAGFLSLCNLFPPRAI